MSLVLYRVWFAVLTVVGFTVPSPHVFIWGAIGLSSVVAVLLGIRRNRPRRKTPWVLLAAAIACLVLGDVIADVLVRWFNNPNPVPSVVDVFYLAMYPLIAAGFWGLFRQGLV